MLLAPPPSTRCLLHGGARVSTSTPINLTGIPALGPCDPAGPGGAGGATGGHGAGFIPKQSAAEALSVVPRRNQRTQIDRQRNLRRIFLCAPRGILAPSKDVPARRASPGRRLRRPTPKVFHQCYPCDASTGVVRGVWGRSRATCLGLESHGFMDGAIFGASQATDSAPTRRHPHSRRQGQE